MAAADTGRVSPRRRLWRVCRTGCRLLVEPMTALGRGQQPGLRVILRRWSYSLSATRCDGRSASEGWGRFGLPGTRRLDRAVAVKVPAQALNADPTFVARSEREARHAAHLNHPNIVTIFDLGTDGDVSYPVMELVIGESLAELLRRKVQRSKDSRDLPVGPERLGRSPRSFHYPPRRKALEHFDEASRGQ